MATEANQYQVPSIIRANGHLATAAENFAMSDSFGQAPVYLDTCALANPVTPILYRFLSGLGIPSQVVVLRCVCEEITKLYVSSDPEKHEAGDRAGQALAMLHSLPRVTVILNYDEPSATYADPDLIKHAWMSRGRILTADVNLQKEARASEVGIIDINAIRSRLRELTPELVDMFPPMRSYKQGDTLSVYIKQSGEKDGQGVGYLDDGRKVIVNGGEFHRGAEVDVEVTKILQHSYGSEMIFGELKHSTGTSAA